jgi:hypothetical protein
VTVTGTAIRDVIDINLDSSQLTVDFGFDGTLDARFPMSHVQRLRVLGGDGDDGITVEGTGVGDVPITINGGRGNDGGGVVSFADPILAGDAPVSILGGGGNDDFIASVPGPSRSMPAPATTGSKAEARARRRSRSATATTPT